MQGAAAVETIRDINVASRLIGDMSGSTLDDPLFDRYKKLGCSISSVEKDTEDYKMVANYLEKTYEPIKVGEIVSNPLCSSDLRSHNVSIYMNYHIVSFVRVTACLLRMCLRSKSALVHHSMK